VQAYVVGQGIDAGRITATSHGKADQIAGGNAVNRRATVTVVDPRNEFPGTPAVGRP
jgi:outer membrane protein OmpA-like peptidoglycan-associated protein